MTDPSRIFSIKLYRHTGAVILWHQQGFTVTGNLDQCEAAYRNAQTHNLALGWWSVVSVLVMNWIALFSNMSAIKRVRDMAKLPPGAFPANYAPNYAAGYPPTQPVPPGPPPQGWYPDPSGSGQQRFWDGTTWTHWTHPR